MFHLHQSNKIQAVLSALSTGNYIIVKGVENRYRLGTGGDKDFATFTIRCCPPCHDLFPQKSLKFVLYLCTNPCQIKILLENLDPLQPIEIQPDLLLRCDPDFFWSVVHAANIMSNARSLALPFKEMLKIIAPGVDWEWIHEGERDGVRKRKLSEKEKNNLMQSKSVV